MKIAVIKLGADGDVLRTLPIVRAIREKHPSAKITWITKESIAGLLKPISYIDQVVCIPYTLKDSFDELYNFDLETDALELASSIAAKKKYGFYGEGGYPLAFNTGAEYYLNTVFDDELKKSNKKTYQEMMFALAELLPSRTPYQLILSEKERAYAKAFARKHKIQSNVIGIHMGASSRWPSKVWAAEQVERFIISLAKRDIQVILFGGPNEIKTQKSFVQQLNKKGITIVHNDPHNTKGEFASLVQLCQAVVCSDSFALHVAVGLGKKTVALFFVTSPNEVETYELVTKLVAPKLYDFFPQRSDEYNTELVNSISPETVLKALNLD